MDNTKQNAGKVEGAGNISEAISTISLIESLFGAEENIPSEITFQLPLASVLAMFPARYVKETPPGLTSQDTVSITLDDLFAQLSKGKVSVSAAKLAFFVPSHLLHDGAFSDTTTMIALPLSAIVKAVGADKLKSHVAHKVRHYKIDTIKDPFKDIFEKSGGAPAEQASAPAAASVASVPPATVTAVTPLPPSHAETPVEKAVEEIKPAPEPAAPVPSAPRRKPARKPAPEQMVSELSFHELPGNVNLNTATLEELLTLDGVTRHLAENIIKYRVENGQFSSIFDLARVPRCGRKTFKQITGTPFNKAGYHRRYKLAQWLNLPVDKVTELPQLAAAIAKRQGFSGCVICDKDGLLLAQNKAEEYGENWGAVASKILTQVRENVQLVNAGDVESVSLDVKGKIITVVGGRNAVLTVIHDKRKMTKSLLMLIQKIGQEITWLLGRRVYVGR